MRLSVPRIGAATLALTLLTAAGCSPSGTPRSTVDTIDRVTYLTGFGLLGQDSYMFVAREKGFFREAGIEVDIKPGAGTGENLKLLLANRATFAIVDLTGALLAYGKGTRGFTTVAAIHQRSVSCIVTLASAGISAPRDLAGHTIGYQPGGVNYTLFPVYAQLAGLDPATIHWVSMPPPQLRAALASGRVDAITELVTGRPGVEALADGRSAVVLPYSDYLTDLYGNAIATTAQTAASNPDLVRRFRDATLRGLAYVVDHPDEAGQVFARYQPQYRPAVAAAELRLMAPYVRPEQFGRPLGALDEQRVMRSIAVLQGAGALPPGVVPSDVVTFELPPGPPGHPPTIAGR
jgi:NitT/TauT family transport system substrate-binding protein